MLRTKAQAAQALAISIRQLELYVKSGKIAVRHLGTRCVRIEQAEIDRFIESLATTAKAS